MRNIYPMSSWHWAVMVDGQMVDIKSYSNLVYCIIGASTVGIYSVLKTEKQLKDNP